MHFLPTSTVSTFKYDHVSNLFLSLHLQGMVDPGEQVSLTLKREFLEEAMDSGSMSDAEKKAVEREVSKHFEHGNEVLTLYIDLFSIL